MHLVINRCLRIAAETTGVHRSGVGTGEIGTFQQPTRRAGLAGFAQSRPQSRLPGAPPPVEHTEPLSRGEHQAPGRSVGKTDHERVTSQSSVLRPSRVDSPGLPPFGGRASWRIHVFSEWPVTFDGPRTRNVQTDMPSFDIVGLRTVVVAPQYQHIDRARIPGPTQSLPERRSLTFDYLGTTAWLSPPSCPATQHRQCRLTKRRF